MFRFSSTKRRGLKYKEIYFLKKKKKKKKSISAEWRRCRNFANLMLQIRVRKSDDLAASSFTQFLFQFYQEKYDIVCV